MRRSGRVLLPHKSRSIGALQVSKEDRASISIPKRKATPGRGRGLGQGQGSLSASYRKPPQCQRETKNEFACKLSTRSQSYHNIPSKVLAELRRNPSGYPKKGFQPINNFCKQGEGDARYEVCLGGVSVEQLAERQQDQHQRAERKQAGDELAVERERIASYNRTSRIPFPSHSASAEVLRVPVNCGTRESQSMVSLPQGRNQISLLEQKQRQWAKEREELSGLWSPWGKNPNKIVSQNVHSIGKGNGQDPMKRFEHHTTDDHYLPPINDSRQNLNSRNGQQRSNSLIPGTLEPGLDRGASRKSSLPDNGERTIQLRPYEHRSTYHREGNAEWMIIHNEPNNNNSDPSSNDMKTFHGGSGDGMGTVAAVTPRVIVHKITMDSSDNATVFSRNGVASGPSPNFSGPYEQARQNTGNGRPLTRSFGGSTGSISGGRPPAPAMRSSLTIGVPPSRDAFGGSYESVERQEREQWLQELEKQREEQRLRKLMEKEEKRARWGDRGVGVGHFWEPSDSSAARLPSRERDNSRLYTGGGTTPPAWLQRSLELQSASSSSRSQPNLYDGPLPSDFALAIENNFNSMPMPTHHGHNVHFNRSSFDLSGRDRDPVSPGTTVDGGATKPNETSNAEQMRTFLRGQNLPIDSDEKAERERKYKANQEYLEEVKKQIEDRKRRQQEEKDREQWEEREHEARMAQQRELELQRLQMEKRQTARSTSPSKVPSNNSDSTLGDTTSPNQDFSSYKGRRDQNECQRRESPVISHRGVALEHDAYELAIAQRQAMMLENNPPVSLDKSESNRNFSGEKNRKIILPESSSVESDTTTTAIYNPHGGGTIDQCMMTDSDHIYERVLTPSTDRRSRSMDTARSREFGTQTELSDETTEADTDQDQINRASKRSKSISNLRKENEDKPRWGANPVKKVYLKQSEKDPNYQTRLRRQQQLAQLNSTAGETDTTNENDCDKGSDATPFHRVQSRARTKERYRKSKSPLKALPSHHHYSYGQNNSHVSSHIRQQEEYSLTAHKNTEPKLSRGGKGGVKGSTKSSRIYGSDSSLNLNIAQKHLGHIDGLNSVGASEESCTGSGCTSPSIQNDSSRPNCSTGDSNRSNGSSLKSSESTSNVTSEYTPLYSKEFQSQQAFDETPIGGGKVNPNLEKAFVTSRLNNFGPNSSRRTVKVESKPLSKSKLGLQKQAQRKVGMIKERGQRHGQSSQDYFTTKDVESDSTTTEFQRLQSPPVPALAKKLELGLMPDNSGRVSSLPPELLSPIPSVPLGSIIPYVPPSLFDESRISSAEPKVDIDIAITHASNPDLQLLLHNFEQASALASGRSEITNASFRSGEEDELLKLPEIISGRSAGSAYGVSRPVTNATELSIQAQEEFIREIMSKKEIQEQLSAREKELNEKGIIEFNVRLPATWATTPPFLDSGNRKARSSQATRHTDASLESRAYRDPLLSHTHSPDKDKATEKWLRNLEKPSTHDSILTNLTSLKQGIRLQQELVQTTSRDGFD